MQSKPLAIIKKAVVIDENGSYARVNNSDCAGVGVLSILRLCQNANARLVPRDRGYQHSW